MLTTIVLAALLLCMLGGYVVWSRRSAPPRTQLRAPPHPGAATTVGYRCVEIERRGAPCEASARYAGKRLLPNEAPALPVPGCTNPQCACRYLHHDERRQGMRRNPYGQFAGHLPPGLAGERRTRRDRRRTGAYASPERAQRV